MDECLEYLHSELLQSLGTVMQGVAKELSALGRNCEFYVRIVLVSLFNNAMFDSW